MKLFLSLLIATLFGFSLGYLPSTKGAKVQPGIHPEKEYAISKLNSFAIVLIAHNDALWCEQALGSLFAQDYDHFRLLFIDDGSQDDTYEKVQEFVLANKEEHRVILMRNEKELGAAASLSRLASHCLNHEIVLPLSARDWLTSPDVLSSLNHTFQNPDVWIVCGKTLNYPSYDFLPLPEWNLKKIEKKGYSDYQGLRAFYGALLKQLPQPTTLAKDFSLIPLLELSGGRVKNLPEPLSFHNIVLPVPGPSQVINSDIK